MDSPCSLIAVAGGTGSGKSTLASQIVSRLNDVVSTGYLSCDFYYKDQSDIPFEERLTVNYDHPDSIEFDLLVSHLDQLKHGQGISHPTYDFGAHTRSGEWQPMPACQVVVIEGILVLNHTPLVELVDLRVFVDTPDDIRLARRITRDTKERQRSIDNVLEQYLATVLPMHQQFVEPSRAQADLIVSGTRPYTILVELIHAWVERKKFVTMSS